MQPPVLIAADHAGVHLKDALIRALSAWRWVDLGTNVAPDGRVSRVDYPDFAALLSDRLLGSDIPVGILICGSGIGMAIAANKFPGIRAATAENPVSARLAREHNHANVLCLGARFLAPEYAAEIAEIFLKTNFNHDPRHEKRVEKIKLLEK